MLLTVFDVLARRQVTERAMGPRVIVVVGPGLEKLLGVDPIREAAHGEAVVTLRATDARRSHLLDSAIRTCRGAQMP